MILALKQKAFSLKETFTVFNEAGESLYEIKGKLISLGHRLTLKDMNGETLGYIHQKLISVTPKYFIEMDGKEEVELKGHITLIHPHYTLETENGKWEIRGDFMEHEYEMTCNDAVVATVTKKWFSWGDSYTLNVVNDDDAMIALGVLIAIDCVCADRNRAESSTIANATK